MGDLQRANMWKRISAAFFDLIILAVVAIGAALLLTVILDYDALVEEQAAQLARYEAEYGVDFDVLYSTEEYEKLTEEEKAVYEKAQQACNNDPDVIRTNAMLTNLTLLIVVFGMLAAYLLMELLVPLLLRNGQTFGKKLFGLAVMREDGVRATPFLIAVRGILGKYTVEAMLPIGILTMMLFGMTGIVGFGVLVLLFIGQIVLVASTQGRTPIHDLFARTVVVDFASQRIFETVADKDAYYERLRAEMTDPSDY